MLFLNKDGVYIEILRKDYLDDISYYTAILKVKFDYVDKPKREYRIFH